MTENRIKYERLANHTIRVTRRGIILGNIKRVYSNAFQYIPFAEGEKESNAFLTIKSCKKHIEERYSEGNV